MSAGKDMYFMGKSKIMDFECGPMSSEADRKKKRERKKKSIVQLGERTLKLKEVKVDI